mgnify:CR=1 FL=1
MGASQLINKFKVWLNAILVVRRYVKNWWFLIMLAILNRQGIFVAKNGTRTESVEAKAVLKALVIYDDELRRHRKCLPLSFGGHLFELPVLGGFGRIKYDPSKLPYAPFHRPEVLIKEYDVDVKGKVVLDVGAYHGDSVLLWLWKGAQQVIAVEPVPEHFEALRESTRGFPVIAIKAAVGMPIPKLPSRYVGLSGYGIKHAQEAQGWLEVPILELTSLVKQYKPMVVKIDCEGCEHAILEDIAKLPSLGVKTVIVELHDIPDGSRKEEALSYLKERLRGTLRITQCSKGAVTAIWENL